MEEKYQQLGESFSFICSSGVSRYTPQLLNTSCMCSWGKHSTDNLLSLTRHKTRAAYQIKDAIYHMSETYFTKLDTEYTFTHGFIFEAIANGNISLALVKERNK
jgi:hypothetical protein